MESNTEPTPIAATPSPAPAGPVVAAPRARRDPLPIVLALAALVAVGGVSFAGGRLSAPQAAAGLPGSGRVPGNGQGNGQANGQGNGVGNLGRGLGSGVAIRGTVTAVAADHLTIRMDSGQTVDIPISSATTYHRQTAATATDVATGTPVLVQVEPNLGGGAGPVQPNASNLPGGLGRFIGTARDITIVAQ
jgi:hypothetical protein